MLELIKEIMVMLVFLLSVIILALMLYEMYQENKSNEEFRIAHEKMIEAMRAETERLKAEQVQEK